MLNEYNYKDLFLLRDINQFNWIDLSANELFYNKYSKYPFPYWWEKLLNLLIFKINTYYNSNLSIKNILLIDGAEEAIDLFMRLSNNVIFSNPTFFLYEYYAKLNNVKYTNVPIKISNWKIYTDDFLKFINKDSEILFIVNPWNPIPIYYSEEYLIKIIKNFKWLVVIDEAYIDFLWADKSFLSKINNFDNLLIVHTLSKSNWLAWSRIWFIFWNEKIIEKIKEYKSPYSISSLIIDYLYEYFYKDYYFIDKEKIITSVLNNRKIFIKELNKIPIVEFILDWKTNFILVKFKSIVNINNLFNFLISNNILVSPSFKQSNELKNILRISIWKEKDLNLLINLLNEYVKK